MVRAMSPTSSSHGFDTLRALTTPQGDVWIHRLDLLGREKQPLSALVAPLRRYFASGELNRRVADPKAILAALAEEHRGAREVSHMDGLLVRYDDWWFNMRPSNTEPLLRLNVEAKSEAQMERERDRLLARMV